jgi:penicillin-binding protein 2
MPVGADAVFARRTRILYWVFTSIALVFAGRLWLLQVVQGERLRGQAHANSRKERQIAAPRGLIVDRKGRMLVGNRVSYDLVLDRERMDDALAVAAWVAQVTGEEPEAVARRIQESKEPSFRPVTLARDLAFSQVAYVEARREDLPELSIETRILRQYPNGSVAAHALGYVSEISEAELARPELKHHHARDLVGKSGIERTYDAILSGTPGVRRNTVNNLGREISTEIVVEPVPGANVHLAIDLEVQRAAEEALAGRRGAVVMLDARDGSVLAIASSPTYDPNAFVGGISDVRWKQYNEDSTKPLQFRAIAGTYPPGSVWKALVSGAAIQSGKHRPSTTVTCLGSMVIYGSVRHCWKEEGHGTISMMPALIHSCNVYYYTAGRDIGWRPIIELGEEIGFGKATGIDLPGEVGGVLPSDAWKRKTLKEQWYPGDTINLAIGQGFLGVTPLQAAQFGMTIANRGTVHRPHLFDHASDPLTGETTHRSEDAVVSQVDWKPETLDFLYEALEGVVTKGTGTRAKLPGVRVAGKTGTAQPSSGEAPKGMPRDKRPERYQEHAWFMGFAPVEAPEVAFAIVLEHVGLHGGEAAAPVAHDILAAYFADRAVVAGQ